MPNVTTPSGVLICPRSSTKYQVKARIPEPDVTSASTQSPSVATPSIASSVSMAAVARFDFATKHSIGMVIVSKAAATVRRALISFRFMGCHFEF